MECFKGRYWPHKLRYIHALRVYRRALTVRTLTIDIQLYQAYCLHSAYWRPVTQTKSSHNHRLCVYIHIYIDTHARFGPFFFILFRSCLNARKYVSYQCTTLIEWVCYWFIRKVFSIHTHSIVSVCCKMFEIIFKRSSVSIVAQCRHFSSFNKTKQNIIIIIKKK